jgi:hypothetical protein
MKSILMAVAVVGVACAASACAGKIQPAAKAASVQQTCTASGDDVRLLQSTTVLGARPLYSHVITGKNDSEERVTGAQLVVRAPDGVSSERLARVLTCHSAQALLGQVDTTRFAADPYWLPDAWLDIDVKSENGNFTVVLRADNVPDGLKVLHRATAFAESQRRALDP